MSDALKFLSNTLSAGAGLATGLEIGIRAGWRNQPRPMPHQLAPLLENPLRLAYRNPGETLGLFGFVAEMTALDLGCGSGLFTAEMARMVGPRGVVHAVDAQLPFLARTEQRLAQAGLAERVHLHHCGAYRLPLPDASVDLAVIIATLGEIPQPLQALGEVKRVLKPGARLAISDEILSPAYRSSAYVRRMAEAAGFRFGGKTGTAFCYSMIFMNDSMNDSVNGPVVNAVTDPASTRSNAGINGV